MSWEVTGTTTPVQLQETPISPLIVMVTQGMFSLDFLFHPRVKHLIGLEKISDSPEGLKPQN